MTLTELCSLASRALREPREHAEGHTGQDGPNKGKSDVGDKDLALHQGEDSGHRR